jgi:hypothetical protein
MVSSAFGLNYEGLSKPSLLRNFENFLKEQAASGKRVLLIVDEAQNLPIKTLEELRMLSNFQDENRALFQSFLVGQEEFRQILKIEHLEQLRQRIIASYHLGPLSKGDTDIYIKHRLEQVGWNADPTFTDEAISAIYKFTSGVPRKINTLCDRLLLLASLEEAHTIDDKLVKLVTQELEEEVGFDDINSNVIDVASRKTIDKSGFSNKLAALEKRVENLEKIIEAFRIAVTTTEKTTANSKKRRK